MTLEQARTLAVQSTSHVVLSCKINGRTNADAFLEMRLDEDQLNINGFYRAVWENQNERFKLILETDDIADQICLIKIWMLNM